MASRNLSVSEILSKNPLTNEETRQLIEEVADAGASVAEIEKYILEHLRKPRGKKPSRRTRGMSRSQRVEAKEQRRFRQETFAGIASKPRLTIFQAEYLETRNEDAADAFGDKGYTGLRTRDVLRGFDDVEADEMDEEDVGEDMEGSNSSVTSWWQSDRLASYESQPNGWVCVKEGEIWAATLRSPSDRNPGPRPGTKSKSPPVQQQKVRHHYACTTCGDEVVTKKRLDPTQPIYCKQCFPQRRRPANDGMMVVAI